MFKLFKKEYVDLGVLKTDMHSHILPGIDDGSADLDESMELIRKFYDLGYRKLIATPHIMQDYYPNTPEVIRHKLRQVREMVSNEGLGIEIEASAEYYLDEFLLENIESGQELLLMSGKYLLFEMSFMEESPFLKEFIFKIRSRGLYPILAHAERYSYYFGKPEMITDLMERGCLIQININSLTGYYTKQVRQLAEKLVDLGHVHLLGSDCHRMDHLIRIKEASSLKYLKKALNLRLLNQEL